MTITKRINKGSALTFQELDGNFTDLENRMGWSDYNDVTTHTTPIELTTPGTFYGLTNDGAGSFSQSTYKIPTHGEIWNTTTNRFDFSSLKLGDTVSFRVDVIIETSGPARDIEGRLELAIGSPGPYSLPVDLQSFKSAGIYQVVRLPSIYMGDTNTLNFPARFAVASDGIGTTAKVNGWYVITHVR